MVDQRSEAALIRQSEISYGNKGVDSPERVTAKDFDRLSPPALRRQES